MLTDAAEKLKVKNASKVDVSARKTETFLNGVDEVSRKAKINRTIANVSEDMPKILDNGLGKVLKKGGKALSIVGDVLTVADLGLTAYNDYKDDGSLGKDTVKVTAGALGNLGASVVGAKIGAWIGGAVGGVASGGVLAAPLAVLGGFVGGVIGGLVGGDLLESAVERIYD